MKTPKKGEEIDLNSYNLLGDFMKKTFEYIGMISLICFSFFYTNRISTVIKQNDDIMVELNAIKENYIEEGIEAVIDGNTIIPGLSGKEIDVDKSYKKMKKFGSFNDNLLVYKDLKPINLLKDNYDKYIIKGNTSRKEVSLIFLIDNNDNIDNILSILDNNNIKANFFIDGYWFENNNQIIIDLVSNGHVVGNLSYNLDYKATGFSWMNTIVTKIAKQTTTYCYNEIPNDEGLKICALNKNYTIRPNIIVKSNPLSEIKVALENGSIISMNVNDVVIKELPLIINYIKSKDLEIVNLEELLQE